MLDISLQHSTSTIADCRAASARQVGALLAAAVHLDSILNAKNQSLKIYVDGWSHVFGAQPSCVDLPELTFDNYRECLKSNKNCRIYSFASPFFKGRMRISGSFDRLIDVLYSINISNDVSQSLEEKFFLFAFKNLKEWMPWFAKRFESDFHYSLDARAYELFLDPYLQYTCGRVLPGTRSVDEAQIEKFKLIASWVCEQLGTIKNRRHLDIGCGWGGLISYFRSFYGTESIGLTNCEAQSRYILDQFGFETILGDFTCLQQIKGQFDFVTVIGMSEHVVGRLKDKLLENVFHCLKDNGVLYVQTIEKPELWIGGDAYRIAQELIFPGHDLDFQVEAERRFVAAGFKIVHAENHTMDYADTTGEWAKRVNREFSKLKSLIGTKKANLFLMYLLYASKLFRYGRGKLMRYALTKG
jgi:cyclopropane fatty-acyl-phospholipid synthase-like methyltransferase